MIEAVIYTRFSPRPDAATSESCEMQEGLCRDYAAAHGWECAAVFADADVSGADEFRDKLWAAIDSLKKGGVLLVWKRDRLARNVYLAEMINRAVAKKGGRIVAVSGDVEGDGPEQVLVRQVVAAMAEYERKLIGIRTSAALRLYQSQGRRVSRIPPYGWDVSAEDPGRLVRNEAEQGVIAEVVGMRGRGMGLREIARRLDPSASRSGRWSPAAVMRILRRAGTQS